jgi:hypothetical protein
MSSYETEDIRGYEVDGEHFHPGCLGAREVTEEDILTDESLEKDHAGETLFCDECSKVI